MAEDGGGGEALILAVDFAHQVVVHVSLPRHDFFFLGLLSQLIKICWFWLLFCETKYMSKEEEEEEEEEEIKERYIVLVLLVFGRELTLIINRREREKCGEREKRGFECGNEN